MKVFKIICASLFIMFVVYAQTANLSISDSRLSPRLLNYQGYLTDDQGIPVTNPSLSMTFSIYDALTSGNQKWTETQSSVDVDKGVFSVILGSVTPIPDTVFTAGTDRWLELAVAGQTLSPRTRIVSTPYAYTSTYSDTSLYAFNALADNDWATNDSVLYTAKYWGLARGGAGNVLYGNNAFTHVNFGVACTTGLSGQNYFYATVAGGQRNKASHTNATVCGGYNNTANGGGALIAGGSSNYANGSGTVVTGGLGDTASAAYSFIGGGYKNTASGFYSFLGGGQYNRSRGQYSVVCGGGSMSLADSNSAIGDYSAILGGRRNVASGDNAVVGGGFVNTASGFDATVSGGEGNIASAARATVAGGYGNTASNQASIVSGGAWNEATAMYSTVGGGANNNSTADYSFIGGGNHNNSSADYAFVGGGYYNGAIGSYATTGGGYLNVASNDYATVVGGYADTANAPWAGVLGGYRNEASDTGAVVIGGALNKAEGVYSNIGGGYYNRITATGDYSYLFGINSNLTQDSTFMVDMPHVRFGTEANGYEFPRQRGANGQAMVTNGSGQLSWSTLASDTDWVIAGNNQYSGVSGNVGIGTSMPRYRLDVNGIICGGLGCVASGSYSHVGGGCYNTASGSVTTVAGGSNNNVSGNVAIVGGGYLNSASGDYSAIIGGYADTILSTADYSYLFGINSNLTQDSTFMVDMPHVWFGTEATGYEFPRTRGTNGQIMVTNGSGQLSWSSVPSDNDWVIAGSDQYSGVSGNVGIGTTTPEKKLSVNGEIKWGNENYLNTDQGGAIELGYSPGTATTPFIDFHYGVGSAQDYNMRIINDVNGQLHVKGQSPQNFIVDGNVGIGTTSPTQKLDVNGTARMTGFALPTGATNGYVLTSNASGTGSWQAIPNDNDWVIAGSNQYSGVSGNVGIGTSSPGYKLTVNGVICGGTNCVASGSYAHVGGGYYNTASAAYTTVAGGYYNYANAGSATIPGGYGDTASAFESFAANYSTKVSSGHNNSAAFTTSHTTAADQVRAAAFSTGTIDFAMDHPDDPMNKILNQYGVSSDEVQSQYSGSVVLDANGRVVVNLPDYFDDINRNPRIQLTGVGSSDVYVAEKIRNNRFVVGGKPGIEVYWEVTAERTDIHAEIARINTPVVQEKTGTLQDHSIDDDAMIGIYDDIKGKNPGLFVFKTEEGRRVHEQSKQSAERNE